MPESESNIFHAYPPRQLYNCKAFHWDFTGKTEFSHINIMIINDDRNQKLEQFSEFSTTLSGTSIEISSTSEKFWNRMTKTCSFWGVLFNKLT